MLRAQVQNHTQITWNGINNTSKSNADLFPNENK